MHARELFRMLKDDPDIELWLVKGKGPSSDREKALPIFYRRSLGAQTLGKLTNKNPYIIQNLSFAISLIPWLTRKKPAVLYLADPPLYRYLARWRRWSGLRYRMIFHTGGNTIPPGFEACDQLQAVTPAAVELALRHRIEKSHVTLLPHFTTAGSTALPYPSKAAARLALQIDPHRLVILSVGAIDRSVKRMDYVIREVAQLRTPFYLLIMGEEESETPELRRLASELLPVGSYRLSKAPHDTLAAYYQAADIFALGSLDEGFGLAALDALAFGLPTILHPHANGSYVLGDLGYFADLTQTGNLTKTIESFLPWKEDPVQTKSRKDSATARFGLDALRNSYRSLILQSLQSPQ